MEEAAGAFFENLSEGVQPTEEELTVTQWKASEVPAMIAAQFAVSQLVGESGAGANAAVQKLRKAALDLRQEKRQEMPDPEKVDEKTEACWKIIGATKILPVDGLVQE